MESLEGKRNSNVCHLILKLSPICKGVFISNYNCVLSLLTSYMKEFQVYRQAANTIQRIPTYHLSRLTKFAAFLAHVLSVYICIVDMYIHITHIYVLLFFQKYIVYVILLYLLMFQCAKNKNIFLCNHLWLSNSETLI